MGHEFNGGAMCASDAHPKPSSPLRRTTAIGCDTVDRLPFPLRLQLASTPSPLRGPRTSGTSRQPVALSLKPSSRTILGMLERRLVLRRQGSDAQRNSRTNDDRFVTVTNNIHRHSTWQPCHQDFTKRHIGVHSRVARVPGTRRSFASDRQSSWYWGFFSGGSFNSLVANSRRTKPCPGCNRAYAHEVDIASKS
jgi:hypothetical protein